MNHHSSPFQVNQANGANARDVIFDAASYLAAAQHGLPPGVTASLDLVGTQLVIIYRLRIMVRGKRHSYGPFINKQQAKDAWLSHKQGALVAHNASAVASHAMQASHVNYVNHINPMERQDFNFNPSSVSNANANASFANAVSFPPSSFVQLAPAATQSKAPAQSEASLLTSLQEIDDVIIAAGIAPHELTGDSMLTVQLPDGKEFYISAAMQREYNAWFVAGMPLDWALTRSDSSTPFKPKEQAQVEQDEQGGQQSDAAGASALSLDDL